MAYPYLPVNPCCTDIVLNSPCGCSSTITNSGCNSNDPCSTNLTASSTIVYNGPVLSCIIAEPCDTLNVILQKIDEIICNLLIQINTLNIQVHNITGQIININGDIINIYNTLDVCCNVTTTSTTTIHPCESFSLTNTSVDPIAIIITDCTTGLQEAILILPGDTNICVETDSPLTVPGTIIVVPNGPCGISTTTTSSSSSSSTTTTTTTAIPCECLTFTNTSSSAIDYNISYNDCLGDLIDTTISANAILQFCGCCGSADSPLVTITIGANCIDGVCPTPLINCIFTGDANEITTTTTTSSSSTSTSTSTTTSAPTTTTTTTVICKIYTVIKTVEPAAGWEATLCVDGSIVSGNANSSGSLNTPCVVQDSLILDAGVEIRDINECDACISYTVECFYILGGTWSADNCNGDKIGGSLAQFESVSTGCIQIATLSLTDVVITALEGLCTTTTTTTIL